MADQSGSEFGVPFAGSSVIMDLAGPSTLAQMSETEEGLIVQVPMVATVALHKCALIPSPAVPLQRFYDRPLKSAARAAPSSIAATS